MNAYSPSKFWKENLLFTHRKSRIKTKAEKEKGKSRRGLGEKKALFGLV